MMRIAAEEEMAAVREGVAAAVVVRVGRLPVVRWAPAGVPTAVILGRMNEACPAHRSNARSAAQL